MSAFAKTHPVVQLAFFVVSIVLAMAANHPFFTVTTLLCAVLYAFVIKGTKALKTLSFALAVTVLAALANFVFVHYGATTLFTVGQVAFSVEPLFYGFHQGMLAASLLIWLTALSVAIDSEKVIYLFRFAPKTALVFSMVLGFIPRFLQKISDIREAQLALNGGKREHRFQALLSDFSALVSYSLECSVVTSQSMSAREYNPKAVMPSRYPLRVADALWLVLINAVAVWVIVQKVRGNIAFDFEPWMNNEALSLTAGGLFILLELLPTLLDTTEMLAWKLSAAKV